MAEPTPSVDVLTRMDDLERASWLINDTWSAALMPPNLARAIQQAGGYVAGIRVDGHLCGASVGFLGEVDGQRILHSHVTAVTDRHRGLGAAIKLHQRRWCRDRDIAGITWTFDPLVSRNAYFNLRKLGAVADAYLPNHYGAMADRVNAGDETDRLHVWWAVDGEPSRAGTTDVDALLLLDVDEREEPAVVGSLAEAAGRPLAVRIPHDIDALRVDDLALAQRWRKACREAMTEAYDAGYRATDMRRDGTYLLTTTAVEARR